LNQETIHVRTTLTPSIHIRLKETSTIYRCFIVEILSSTMKLQVPDRSGKINIPSTPSDDNEDYGNDGKDSNPEEDDDNED
ncbi:unnamed protein product, partial [Candidula unifasciata]